MYQKSPGQLFIKYAIPQMIGLLFNSIYIIVDGVFIGTQLGSKALAIGSLSNILLDYIFMYPLNMGIGGAALATAVGPVISVLILLPHFLMKKGYLYFQKDRLRPETLKWFFTLGFPSFVMEFSIGMVTFNPIKIFHLQIQVHI